jgi:hypothetical protein
VRAIESLWQLVLVEDADAVDARGKAAGRATPERAPDLSTVANGRLDYGNGLPAGSVSNRPILQPGQQHRPALSLFGQTYFLLTRWGVPIKLEA